MGDFLITFFTVPKAFEGHIAVIQRNAILSWKSLDPDCEIILFGNESGIDEIARKFNLIHVPDVAKNEYGTPLLNDIFEKANTFTINDVLCYVNADIILLQDIIKTVKSIGQLKRDYLIVGQRWNLDITNEINYTDDWEKTLRKNVLECGTLSTQDAIDYFIFPRNFWEEIPPFAIGRTSWDNWLIYNARKRGKKVIDASKAVMIIHQNHDYSHVKDGDAWKGFEAGKNRLLADGGLYTLDDSNCYLSNDLILRFKRPELIFFIARFKKILFIIKGHSINLIINIKNAVGRGGKIIC